MGQVSLLRRFILLPCVGFVRHQKKHLEEDVIVEVSNFIIVPATRSYRPTEHLYRVNFQFSTIVCPRKDDHNIPRYGFAFKNFSDILFIDLDNHFLFDYPDMSDKPLGSKVVRLGGDFKQILPVIPRDTVEDTVHVTSNASYLWKYCQLFMLTTNMRLVSYEASHHNQEFLVMLSLAMTINKSQKRHVILRNDYKQ
ncbi:hypothetical protein K1719_012413 [Acacia pycnantha]|nr:hypothetical protein K1719_012413 [Acacia pycnantha]